MDADELVRGLGDGVVPIQNEMLTTETWNVFAETKNVSQCML